MGRAPRFMSSSAPAPRGSSPSRAATSAFGPSTTTRRVIRATTAGELELERQNPAAAAGAFDRAQLNLETAYRYVPNNADIDFALGNLWLDRANQPAVDAPTKTARLSLARKYYGIALKLNPRHVGTLNNCGVLEMAEKHWPLAERFFAAAIDAEPTDAKAYYLLAHVRDEMGKPEEAKAAIEEALRLRPNQKQFLELRDKLASPAPK